MLPRVRMVMTPMLSPKAAPGIQTYCSILVEGAVVHKPACEAVGGDGGWG